MTTSNPTYGAEPLSKAWRTNKSSKPVMELANSLRALRKVVGITSGSKAPQVTFNSSLGHPAAYSRDLDSIIIDPSIALKANSFPIPDINFDVLVGLTAHEVSHKLADTHDVFKNDHSIAIGNFELANDYISKESVAVIGEEIYVDSFMARLFPVMGEYIRRSRQEYKTIASGEIDWDKILRMWLAVGVYGDIPPVANMSNLSLKALGILAPITSRLKSEELSTGQRARLYIDTAEALTKLIFQERLNLQASNPDQSLVIEDSRQKREQDSDKEQPLFGNSSEAANKNRIGNDWLGDKPYGERRTTRKNRRNTKKLFAGSQQIKQTSIHEGLGLLNKSSLKIIPVDLPDIHINSALDSRTAEKISEIINQEVIELESGITEKLTQSVSSPKDNPILKVWNSTMSNASIISRKVPDNKKYIKHNERLVKELDWLKRLRNAMGRETVRVKPHGIIDERNLWRYPIDSNVFKSVIKLPLRKLDIVLLIDGSGSMAGQGQEIYKAAASAVKVLGKVPCYSYTDSSSEIILSRIDRQENLIEVSPAGGTPSGVALVATASQHPNSLIIHFTDGGSNINVSPEQAFELIRQAYPKVYIVDVRMGYGTKILSDRYGTNFKNAKIINIKDYKDFARVFLREVTPVMRSR
jgi:hypothetical protein